MPSQSEVLFSGPDKQKNILRDRLLEAISSVPANSEIIWICYYFNEPTLFSALHQAAKRNVTIDIIIDANPRSPEINQACISAFQNQTNINLILVDSKPLWELFGIRWHAHMHSKIFLFSLPRPYVLIGSYNPTTDKETISSSLIDKIGDHTISHNTLVRIENEIIVDQVYKYHDQLKSKKHIRKLRFNKINNHAYGNNEWSINFLPRVTPHPITNLLKSRDKNAIIRCAISHLKGRSIASPLIKAKKAGKQIELILDASQRRVSQKLLTLLDHHQIKYQQLDSSHQCLMHNKFMIYQSDTTYCVLFGSFNWSMRSWWLNHETIVTSYDPDVISAFETRWLEMHKLG